LGEKITIGEAATTHENMTGEAGARFASIARVA